MKLLFFALSTAGFGETVIGLSLARQLAPLGVESQFIISPVSETVLKRSGMRYTVIEQKMGRLARLLIDEDVRQFKPDAIVLADYYTFTGVFEQRFGLRPWFIEEYGLPILPIDIWEWVKTPFAVDMFEEDRPVDDHLLQMSTWLRPVPLAHPERDGKAVPYRLWEGSERVTRRTKGHLATTFGMGERDPLVLLTVAPWQQQPEENYLSNIGVHVLRGVPALLTHYLRQLPEQTHFMIVGEAPPEIAAQLGDDRVHVLPSCSPARFTTLIGAADLVLSLNIGATTVARAVTSDIPSVVLTNGFAVHDADEAAKAEARIGGFTPTVRDWLSGMLPLHTFRMWPLGWHDFLTPVLTDNPYTDALTTIELLDERAVVEGLTRELYDPATRDARAAARASYLALLDSSVDTRETFAGLASGLGLTL
jgi:hypothetical protein